MENLFTEGEYTSVETEDEDYVTQGATNEFGVVQFKDKNDNDTNRITVLCRVKSTLAPSASIVKLQVYDFDGTTWLDADEDNVTAADTKFTLETILTTDLGKYYDGSYWAAFRVWQEAA